MEDKQFIGKVTEKKFSNGGSILRLSLSPEDKIKLGGDWSNLNIRQSKAGNWYAEIDTWKPAKKAESNANNTDLPF